jgi:hypothetical protein
MALQKHGDRQENFMLMKPLEPPNIYTVAYAQRERPLITDYGSHGKKALKICRGEMEGRPLDAWFLPNV